MSTLVDEKLVNTIRKLLPIHEILGLYLKEQLKIKTTILCTGAAISFFTKDQAPINAMIDKLYLGWFLRLIFNPIIFLRRYFYSLRLIPMVIFSKIKVLN